MVLEEGTVEDVVFVGACVGGTAALDVRGVEVNGGGSALLSPLTLRFKGGSERGAPLSFFFPFAAACAACC